ncbi:glycosyltransferase family 4 protein [Streptococcus suis]|uniref:glycosyltransferase family 4 protein n=1 Tax=Streptococcus suis TaxID=1307 RepID=UPI0005CECCF2|nr:glycosyltransferase family 4 protein [Streptococcus suis]NQH65663.1 glycosyltransferase family 4 protein [Streptococcus suis]NQN74512.1 glycosyltransferase family 4 protein [Streptococcus suis]NQN78440.1 glycosyltransferase family 4 protein [Streptococcus suis]NQN84144.1 glycosyltransferase family 4 protein [Streptococcus suis]CYV08300.1 UDP-D-galactose:(glucosyl)lipopolysaccharide-1%2 C6-D-galactosyltransferase [Streptococcus suis]
MKVLWVSNSPIGPAANILDETYSGTSGGWIQSEYEFLDKKDLEMSFLCFAANISKGDVLEKSNAIGKLYALKAPRVQNGIIPSAELVKQVQDIISRVSPDIIHIWGTETCISNAVSKCSPNIPKVVFIQGLLGIHKRYLGGYFDRKNYAEYYKGIPFESKLRAWLRAKLFIRQAEIEKDTLNNCKNVIIDNDFSEAYCKFVSPAINCYYRVLEPNAVFENYKWSLDKANKHQIFTVFAGSAEKGVQQLLFAIGMLKRKYPDINVLIPGSYNLSAEHKLIPGNANAYETILNNIIHKLGIDENVCFTGRLSPEEMAKHISKAHIFVNPSCMEVHALSLREAMSMGVPCITSLCGSTGSYVKHEKNGFVYRYEEYEFLAYYIDKLFSNNALSEKISRNALDAVAEYQNEKKISLREVYSEMLNEWRE